MSKAGKDVKREHAFKITKGGAKSYIFASESHEDMERYLYIIMSLIYSLPKLFYFFQLG